MTKYDVKIMDREKVEKDVKEHLIEIRKVAQEALDELSDIPDDVLSEMPATLSQILQDISYPTL